MSEVGTFFCSICNEPSTEICVYCTKDTCRNHRCERCLRCSDCCECEVRLTEHEPVVISNGHLPHVIEVQPESGPEPPLE